VILHTVFLLSEKGRIPKFYFAIFEKSKIFFNSYISIKLLYSKKIVVQVLSIITFVEKLIYK
jgi:hypothetical protein